MLMISIIVSQERIGRGRVVMVSWFHINLKMFETLFDNKTLSTKTPEFEAFNLERIIFLTYTTKPCRNLPKMKYF